MGIWIQCTIGASDSLPGGFHRWFGFVVYWRGPVLCELQHVQLRPLPSARILTEGSLLIRRLLPLLAVEDVFEEVVGDVT